ncbi:putative ATP-dependent RNA helicase ucp12 [Yarrowia sp. C11]|nr:putative ATP-dependent RNA helicase ucp12 [Yarrowia sp. E02]KAG5373477.1 putative ATP-dependent RNA helicase ucp12 [Yarrowia sp. C11]
MGKKNVPTPKKAAAEPAAKGKGKGKKTPDPEPLPGPPKPTARQIVANSSWTGKLPATLLHEHVQKLKWERVDYDMRRVKSGFIATVILKQKNPKTQETEEIRYMPPADLVEGKETALEARHLAATYALHRISSHKNLSMVLPTDHKTLWQKCDKKKSEDIKSGQATADDYVPDPFVVKRKREADRADREKKRQIERERAEKSKVEVKVAIESSGTGSGDKSRDKARDKPREPRGPRPRELFPPKSWDYAPKAEMSQELRNLVEKVIKKQVTWEKSEPESSAANEKLVTEITNLGFRKSHVSEALQYAAAESTELLEWLLLHVPEDDLPGKFLPDKYTTGVSFHTLELSREYMVKRFQEDGYNRDVAIDVLEGVGWSERLGNVELCKRLIGQEGDEESRVQELSIEDSESESESESVTVWKEEMEALEAIFEPERLSTGDDRISVSLNCRNLENGLLQGTFWRSNEYPIGFPSIAVRAIKKGHRLPHYIQLAIVRQALEMARDSLAGDAQIWAICEWLEENCCDIIDNPGELAGVSGGVGIVNQTSVVTKRGGNNKSRPIPKANLTTQQIKESFSRRFEGAEWTKMKKSRQSLPAWEKQSDVIDALKSSQIVLVTGETGSGKSTQTVQFILDHMVSTTTTTPNIICTQPRRISAMGLAERVAAERMSQLGSEVGYIIRGENKTSKETLLRFVTTGVLLKMIQGDFKTSLSNVTHVVVDEVHERSVDGDVLLILLKSLLTVFPHLKIVLMSATVDSNTFISYFGGANKVSHVHIEGRTFPVDDIYLDGVIEQSNYGDGEAVNKVITKLGEGVNYQLLSHLIKHVDAQLSAQSSRGGVLIFMPGVAEISQCCAVLTQLGTCHVIPLHSGLSPQQQRTVFSTPPAGKRKVVVATNIAETSITIPDIVAVVDSGRVKETVYDAENNIVRLVSTWVSQAAAKQRRGRAGRVSRGTCYKLYTQQAEQGKMPVRTVPEMSRTPLEQLYLYVKSMNVGDVGKFLSRAIDPPSVAAISTAQSILTNMGCISVSGALTALGKHMSMIPGDLKVAKLLIIGSILGCSKLMLAVAGVLSVKSPFLSLADKRDEIKASRAQFSTGNGDLLTDATAYLEWEARKHVKTTRLWCKENYMSSEVLYNIDSTVKQFSEILRGLNYAVNGTNTSNNLARAVIASSLNQQIAKIRHPEKTFTQTFSGAVQVDPEARQYQYFLEKERVFIHPSSTAFSERNLPQEACFMAYFTRMETSKVFLRDVTPVSKYAMLLFGGKLDIDYTGRGVVISDWLQITCWPRIGVLAAKLRQLLEEGLQRKFDNPKEELDPELVNAVVKLLETDGL